MEYEVLWSESLIDLVKQVNARLAERAGWQCLGGVAVRDGCYLQAMIRETSTRRMIREMGM